MTILVISHTKHYFDGNGNIVGFGSTVKELNSLAEAKGNVIHVGCLYKTTAPPKNVIPYSDKVTFVPIPPYGGQGIKKLSIITNAFIILSTIIRELKKVDYFQFRAPTSMGLYVIPFLTFFSAKKGWYKYAGNWEQPNPPLSSLLQKKWLLKFQRRPITINGEWPGQPAKCLTFENPCLTNEDRKDGAICLRNKPFAPPYNFCFVGRLEKEKGVFNILTALKNHPEVSKIGKIDIVGEGPGMQQIKDAAKTLPFPVVIHGSLARNELFGIYKGSHFIILPSESEGFPKVISEAANFGCIPIVSDVSCIGQYVNARSGYLWNIQMGTFESFFRSIEFNNPADLSNKAAKAHEFAGSFTYEHYIQHLERTVLKQ